MDWNWYQTLAGIAFVLAAIAVWEVLKLRKHLHMEDLTPTRKWTKAINGPRYVPKHKPDQVPEHADEDDWRFYRDFSHVADYLNELYKSEPWSFENTGRLDIAGYGSEYGTEREILIRFNQQKTGTITLSCIHYRRDDPFDIRAKLDLINGRIFNGYDVFHLAQSIGSIVTDEGKFQEYTANIRTAMIDAMWQVGEGAHGNPAMEITFRGKAEWYLKKWLPRNAPAQN